MPAFRIKDGFENLGRNNEIFEICKDILKNKQNLCIMPEGNQEIERNVRPLVKGIFRVAFAAQAETTHEIFIVPIGLDYDDLFNFGKNLIINIGKPISVKSYMQAYIENGAKTTNELRNTLRNALIDLTIHIDTKENYDCFETLFEIACKGISEQNKIYKNPEMKFLLRKKIAQKLVKFESEGQEKIEKLNNLHARLGNLSEILNIKSEDIENLYLSKKNIFVELLKLALLFPVFMVGLLTNILPFYTTLLVRKKTGVKFKGFFSSVYFATAIASFPLFYIFQGAAISFMGGFSFWLFPLIIPLQFILGKVAFYGWYKPYKKLLSSLKLRKLKKESYENYSELKSITDEIVLLLKPE